MAKSPSNAVSNPSIIVVQLPTATVNKTLEIHVSTRNRSQLLNMNAILYELALVANSDAAVIRVSGGYNRQLKGQANQGDDS